MLPGTAVGFLKHNSRHRPVVDITATMLIIIVATDMPMMRATLLMEGGSSEGVFVCSVVVSGVLSDTVVALIGVIIGGPSVRNH